MAVLLAVVLAVVLAFVVVLAVVVVLAAWKCERKYLVTPGTAPYLKASTTNGVSGMRL